MAEEQKTTWVVQIDADVSGLDKKVKDMSPSITGVQKKLQGVHTKINSISGKLETLTKKAAGVGEGMATGFNEADKAFKELRKDILDGYEAVKDITQSFSTMRRQARDIGKALVKGIDEAQVAVYSLMNTMSSPRIMQRTTRNMKEAMRNSIGDNVSNIIDIRRQIAEDLEPQKDPEYKPKSTIDDKNRQLAVDSKNKLVWIENEYNKELKEEQERNARIDEARKARLQEETDRAAELEQKWQETTKAREEYASVDSGGKTTDGSNNIKEQYSVGQKLNQEWKNINSETQKYAQNSSFQAINSTMADTKRITEGRAKALLRVLILSDKERRREEQKLALKRSIQHTENAMARIRNRNGDGNDSYAETRRQVTELHKIENLQERIRKTKWAMSKMEESDKMTPEYKRAATRLQSLSKSIADQEAAMAQIGDYEIGKALSDEHMTKLDERIKEITTRIEELRNAGVNPGMPTQGIRTDISAEADEYSRLNEELKEAQREQSALMNIQQQANAIENVKEKYRETYEAMRDMENNGEAYVDRTHSKRYLELVDDLNVYENKLKELEATYTTMTGSPAPNEADIARYKELTAQLDTYNRKLLELNFQPLHDGLKKVGTYAKKHLGSVLKKAISTVTSGLKKLASLAGKAAKSIAGIFSSKSAKSGANGIGKAVEKLTRKFSNLWSMLMTRFKRRAIAAVFNDIKGVFVEMANLNPQFNESINKMVNSARRLGAQILAILEPIIVRIGPVIEKIADMLASVADKVAQFTANLFGFSDWLGTDKYTKAEKGNYDFAKSMDESTSSTKKATKAAKEYENTVMGFDQLNKLNDTDDGEEASDEAEAQLERVNTRLNAFNLMAKGIRKAFENGDYEEAGKRIANTLGYLANILGNKFGWKKNSEKIKTFLGNVTTTINSFIKWFPAEKLGEVFGDIANTLINSLDFILNDPDHKLDFSGLGDKIGKLLISAFKTIEWDKVGRVLVGVFSALGDIIKGALTATIEDENGNKTTLATAFGNALKDMLKGASEAFDPEHASDILSTIINALNDFIIALTSDPELFGNVGTKLGEAFTKSMDKIDKDKMTTAFKQVASSLGLLIGNFLHSVPWADVFSNLGDLLGILINGIVEGITGGEGSGNFGSTLIVALLGALLGKKLLGSSGGILGTIVALLIAGGGLNGLFGGSGNGEKKELFPGVKDKYGNPWTADDSATDGRTIKRAKEWAPAQAQGNDLRSIASRWLVDGGNTVFSFFHQFFDKDSYQQIYDEFGDMPICIARILMGVRSIGTAVVNNAYALMDTTDVLADWFHLYEKEAFKHMTPEQIEEYKNMSAEEKQYYANMGLFEDRNKPIDWPEVSRETLQRLQEDVSNWSGRAEAYVESMKGKTTEEIEAQQNEERRKAMEAMGMEYSERDASRYSWKHGDGDGEAEAMTAQASDVKSIKDAVVDKPEEDATEEKDDKISQMIEAIQNKDTNLVIKIGSQTIAELAVKGFLAMGAQYGSGV